MSYWHMSGHIYISIHLPLTGITFRGLNVLISYITIDRWTENILFVSSLSQVSNLRYEGYGQKRQRNHVFNMGKNISARGVFIVI